VIPSSVVTLQKTVFNGCAATLKRVIFEDPNNWIAHATLSEALKGNGDPVDVSNPETNALNLVNKSGYGAWKSLNLQKVVS